MALSRSGRLLGKLFRLGIELAARIVRFHVDGLDCVTPNCVMGYWHGDTIGSMMILREFYLRKLPVAAVVTSSWRGDAIEYVISRYGATALRMDDGYAVKHTIRRLQDEAVRGGRILAVTLDGPAGPLHKPKKLLFRMAQQSEREVVCLSFKYKGAVRMNRRWDKYAVPLPFSRIDVSVESLGVISRENLASFPELCSRIKL